MPGPLLILLLLLSPAPSLANGPDLAEGERLFLGICARCHGERGDNPTGGGIAGSGRGDVVRATGGFGQMPPVPLSEAEIDALAGWLAELGKE